MADTELQGVIRLDADTRQASEDVQEFAEQEGQQSGERFGRRFGQNLAGEVSGRMRNLVQRGLGTLGPVGGALQRTIQQQRQEQQQRQPTERRAPSSTARTGMPGQAPQGSAAGSVAGASAQTLAGSVVFSRLRRRFRMVAERLREFGRSIRGATVAAQTSAGTRVAAQLPGGGQRALPGAVQPTRPTGRIGGRAAGAARTAGLVAGGSVLAIAGMAAAAKVATDRLLAFGRRLGQSGGSLAATFAVFDARMRVLRLRLGQAVTPAFRELTEAVLRFTRNNLSELATVISGITRAISSTIESFTQAIAATKALAGIIMSFVRDLARVASGMQPQGVMAGNLPEGVKGDLRAAMGLPEQNALLQMIREMRRNNAALGSLVQQFTGAEPQTAAPIAVPGGAAMERSRPGAMPGPLPENTQGGREGGGVEFQDHGGEFLRRRQDRMERLRQRMNDRLDQIEREDG